MTQPEPKDPATRGFLVREYGRSPGGQTITVLPSRCTIVRDATVAGSPWEVYCDDDWARGPRASCPTYGAAEAAVRLLNVGLGGPAR